MLDLSEIQRKPLFVISCPINSQSGYGHRSRDLVREIINHFSDHYNIKILAQKWGNTPNNALKDTDNLHSYIINQITEQPKVWMQITIPSEFQKVGQVNIGVTAGIESNIAPPSFIEGCNKMDLVIVSSNHSKTVFENSKFNLQHRQTKEEHELKLLTRIVTLFEGYDEDIYGVLPIKSEISSDLDRLPEDNLFLFVGHWLNGSFGHDRKNVAALIKTFYDTFIGAKNKVGLVLKTSLGTYSKPGIYEISKRIHNIKSIYGKDVDFPNIYVVYGDLSDEEMNALYQHSKISAHISLTHGEGFGRPLLEASTSNKPLIVPDWGGHLDFCKYVIEIPGDLNYIDKSVQNDWLIQGSAWTYPDLSHAAKKMMEVFINKSFDTLAGNQKEYVKQFTKTKMGKKLKDILNSNFNLIPEFANLNDIVLPTVEL